MSVALPFTICVATLVAGVFIGRWFRVGVIALATLGLIIVVTTTGTMCEVSAWRCALDAIGLSFLLQSGYFAGAILLDSVASQNADYVRASLGPT